MPADANRLARFAQARNYAVYYGYGCEQELARFDIAVIEPGAHTAIDLVRLQSSGTLVLAYLSVMEVLPHSLEKKLLKKRDFVTKRGRPYINHEYGNYWADLRSAAWKELVIKKAYHLLEDRDFDGLFLDTIGYVEARELGAELRGELTQAATELVKLLRESFPARVLVQNYGVEELVKHTAPFIDGLCWENPPVGQERAKRWFADVLARIVTLKEKYGFQVMILLEAEEKEHGREQIDRGNAEAKERASERADERASERVSEKASERVSERASARVNTRKSYERQEKETTKEKEIEIQEELDKEMESGTRAGTEIVTEAKTGGGDRGREGEGDRDRDRDRDRGGQRLPEQIEEHRIEVITQVFDFLLYKAPPKYINKVNLT